MRLFSIKDLERFSDIKAHVIRTWEQRFSVFTPQRVKNNVRLYSISDVAKLLNITLLMENGDKISKLAGMTTDQIQHQSDLLKMDHAKQKRYIHDLILCMFKNDMDDFESILDKAMISWGIDTTIHRILMPFLQKVNILSYDDTSIEAHFVVTAVRQKLMLAIERLGNNSQPAISALLYLPYGEHYDLLLLYTNYVLKSMGLKVFYLGTNISFSNLQSAIAQKKPDRLYSYTTGKKFPHEQYLSFLKENHPALRLFVGYANTGLVKTSANHHLCYFDLQSLHETV